MKAREARDQIVTTPKPETREPVVHTTDWAEKDRKIARMSCQKQAIETARLLHDMGMFPNFDRSSLLEQIKELTDYYEIDLIGNS